MEGKQKRLDTTIAIIVIIAGLATGGVITAHLLTPKPKGPRYFPEYEVVNSLEEISMPEEPGATEGSSEAASAAEGPAGGIASQPSDAETEQPNAPGESSSADERPSAAERRIIAGTNQRLAQEGVTEFVELTEDLYVRVCARMVIFAAVLQQQENPKAQSLMADFAETQLAKERIDPEEFYEFTKWVASDHDRAERIGEMILREAEKHTDMKIDVSAVPGLAPAPVAPPED